MYFGQTLVSSDKYDITGFEKRPKIENTLTENLNVVQLLDHEYVLMTEAGVKVLEKRFASWDTPTKTKE